MKRRHFILAAAGVLVLSRALAQSARMARIGFLGTGSAAGMADWIGAFRAGLHDLGYVEGKNVSIEYRWADGDYAKAPQLAAELVGMNVDVLVTHGTPGTRAAKQATSKTPIVMATAGDAVVVGLVKSISRPGGNVTGSTFFNPELAAKRLELMKEALPRVTRVAVLTNPTNAAMGPVMDAMRPTAKRLKLDLQEFPVRARGELPDAINAMASKQIGAVVVIEDGLLNAQTKQIGELVTAKRLPAIGLIELADAGALLAYGVNFPEMYRRAAVFVDKILKGANPGDLPIERPTRFDFIINLKSAKALGVTVPHAILVRAERVIQ